MSNLDVAEDGYFRFVCPQCQGRLKAQPATPARRPIAANAASDISYPLRTASWNFESVPCANAQAEAGTKGSSNVPRRHRADRSQNAKRKLKGLLLLVGACLLGGLVRAGIGSLRLVGQAAVEHAVQQEAAKEALQRIEVKDAVRQTGTSDSNDQTLLCAML